MPIVAGLALPALDRSLFGFKKTDRLLTTPTPDEEPPVRDARNDAEAAPELPPLGGLEWNNSLANLLDRIEVIPSSTHSRTPTLQPSIEISIPTRILATRSTETLKQHDARSSQVMASTDFVTTAIPERQQSNTSSISLSRRSNVSSIRSASSKSSVEDGSEHVQARISIDPFAVQTSKMDWFENSFLDIPLNLELTPNYSSNPPSPALSSSVESEHQPDRSSRVSSPTPNTNKPLPRAPSAMVRISQAIPNSASLPELDSAPVTNTLTTKSFPQTERDGLCMSTIRRPPLSRQSLSSQCLPNEDYHPESHSGGVLVSPTTPASTVGIAPSKTTTINLTEQTILGVLLRIRTISDLQAVALTNKAFYQVFKNNESRIVESVLRNSSAPAWELRQLVKREQKRNPYQIKAVQRDLAALKALQAFILMKCDKMCRRSTLEGLAGSNISRKADIEDALWRIWTFCKLFGKGTSHDVSVHAQVMWFEGSMKFEADGRANLKFANEGVPVTKSELEDMSEMWRCLEMLLSGFKGREPEAREAGIFDQCTIEEGRIKTETQYLEEWIYDILSVGPKAVLTMISCSFEHAKVLGVNKWTPPRQGKGRLTFLKTALEQVYRDRLVEDARAKAHDFSRSIQQHALSKQHSAEVDIRPKVGPDPAQILRRSNTEKPIVQSANMMPVLPQRHTTQVDKLTKSNTLAENQQLVAPTRPIIQVETTGLDTERVPIRPDCDPEAVLPNEPHEPYQMPTISPTSNPTVFSSLSMMSNASTRMGATLFPVRQDGVPYRQESVHLTGERSNTDSPEHIIGLQVIDPTDTALALLVKQLGFPPDLARQALAMSDDGSGIDVQRAVELLSQDRRLEPTQKVTQMVELPDSVPRSIADAQRGNEFCEGNCRRVSVRKRSHLRGLINRNSSVRQSAPLGVIMDREDEDSAVYQAANNVPIAMTTVQESPQEPQRGHHILTGFIKSRSSLRSQNSVRSQHSFLRGHQKSSSTGTVDFSEPDTNRSLSPVSPMSTPVVGLGGFTAIRPIPQQSYEDGDQYMRVPMKPKVTLTRVGTGRKPSKRVSFTKFGGRRPGEPPEIIGYAY